jgi:hypothetical protein
MIFTPEMVEHYREHGYVTVDRFVDAADLKKLWGIFEREFSGRKPLQVDASKIDPHIIHGTDPAKAVEMIKAAGLFLEDFLDGRCAMRHLSYFNPGKELPDIFTPALRANAIEAAEKLLEVTAEELMVFACLLWKPAGGGATPWHQEDSFEGDPNQIQCSMGCWIALEDATPENGCMTVVPGTHVGPMRPHPGLGRAEVAPEELARGISIPVSAGGALLFHGRILHGSHTNDSDRERRVLTLSLRSPRARTAAEVIPFGLSSNPRGGPIPSAPL